MSKLMTFIFALAIALPVAGAVAGLTPEVVSAQDMSESDARQELDSAIRETGASADTARAAKGLFDKLIRAKASPEDALIIATFFLADEPAKIKDVAAFADQQIGAGLKGDDLTRKIAQRFGMDD